MKPMLGLLSTLVCALPLVTSAADLAIPALGIRLSDLPVGVASAEVKARIDGYTATLHINTAVLRVDRMEETLPSGADIRNATFRANQEAGFAGSPFANPKGQPTTINGRDAWTTSSAVRSPEGTVNYSSSTLVVVDDHLYRLSAHGWWRGDGPPPDFLVAMKALSSATFEPVDRTSVSGGAPPSGLVKMPYFLPSSNNYYPDASRRRGETGVVDLEFSIDGKGRARDVQESYAVTPELAASTRRMLAETQFHISPGWEDHGYQKLRFTFEVHYALAPRGGRCGELPTRVPDAQLVFVCGSHL